MNLSSTVGFIGLGNMGQPIAMNLLKAGNPLRVYNRSRQKTRPLVQHGAVAVDNSGEVIEPGGVVFTMLADDASLRSVVFGNTNFIERLAPGGVHVSLSTISPATAREM